MTMKSFYIVALFTSGAFFVSCTDYEVKDPNFMPPDVVLNEDVLNQLAMEDMLAEDFYHLSLNAILGTEDGECMKVKALVNNKVMLILVVEIFLIETLRI